MKPGYIIFKIRSAIDEHMELALRLVCLAMAGVASALALFVIHYFFNIFDMESIGFFIMFSVGILIVSVVLLLIMLMVISFTSDISPDEKIRLHNEISMLHADISVLQSDNWLEEVKKSLGDKYHRISSNQRLLDERNRLIRNKKYYLETIEKLVKC